MARQDLSRFLGDSAFCCPACIVLHRAGHRFIFSGALIPKQVKRLVKTKGLSAIVVKDLEGPMALSQAMSEVGDLKHIAVFVPSYHTVFRSCFAVDEIIVMNAVNSAF